MSRAFLQDARFALRLYLKRPGMAMMSTLALALGIGLVTSMYSVANGLFLKAPPVPQPESLYYVTTDKTDSPKSGEMVTVPQEVYADWEEAQTHFREFASFIPGTVNVSGEGEPQRYDGAYVSSTFFGAAGVDVAQGRDFRIEDETEATKPTVIISHQLWNERFAGSLDALGANLRINGVLGTIAFENKLSGKRVVAWAISDTSSAELTA